MEKQVNENNHIEVFTEIYEKCQWGDDKNENYKGSSGGGSKLENNESYIKFLKEFIKFNKFKINSVVDLGCGSWKYGSKIYDDLNVSYTGYDAYKKLIEHNKKQYPDYEFEHLDIIININKIKDADMYILKDVLQHWKNDDIYNFLDSIIEKKNFKYILLCNDYASSSLIKDNCDIFDMVDHYKNDGVYNSYRPLSTELNPLKKYKPISLVNYCGKESSELKQICVIMHKNLI